MIITISGMPGSGKSTVADILAKRLGYRRYYIGGMRREMARKHGITLDELNRIGEKEEWTDREVDEYQRRLGEKEDNVVIEGRTSFFLVKGSVDIFLDVDLEVGARRILKDLKEDSEKRNEGHFETLDDVLEGLKRRISSDSRRYRKYYGMDVTDRSHYDLVIDTTNLGIDDVVERIMEFIRNKR